MSISAAQAASSFVLTVPAPTVPPAPLRRATPGQKALWLVGFGLVANAAVMLLTHLTGHAPDLVLDRAAMAQVAPAPGQMLGARGIYMMPAQLGPTTYGVYLMDVDAGTICVYRAIPDSSKFRLMASRTFKWDVLLDDLNNDPMTPKEVQRIIELQRKRQDLINKGDLPTVEQAPKPDENQPDGTPTVIPAPVPANPAGGAAGAPNAGSGVVFPEMPR